MTDEKRHVLSGTGGSFAWQFPPADDAFSYVVCGDHPALITGVQAIGKPDNDDLWLCDKVLWLGTGGIPTIQIHTVHLWRRPWPLALWVPPRQNLAVMVRRSRFITNFHREPLPFPLRFTWEPSANEF